MPSDKPGKQRTEWTIDDEFADQHDLTITAKCHNPYRAVLCHPCPTETPRRESRRVGRGGQATGIAQAGEVTDTLFRLPRM